MKFLFLFLIFGCAVLVSQAQIETDTLSSYPMENGYRQITLMQNGDTIIHYRYKNGQLESERPLANGKYKRYDTQGNLMWEQEMIDGKGNGQMKFYDPSGNHLGTFVVQNDSVTDTLYLDTSKTFVFGRFTYSSVMYGGMRRPDGSSNISRSEGGKRFTRLYAVKHDKSRNPCKYTEFNTDVNGFFFFIAEEGSFGIFPDYFELEEVQSDMGAPRDRNKTAIVKQWNISAPIELKETFCYLSLHVHSIGYAP